MADPTLPAIGDPAPGWVTTLHNAIMAAYRLAQQALASVTGVPAVVQVDGFPGATDAAKMSAALTYASQQSRVPWLQLPARVFNTGTATFSLFTGCKIMGPGRNSGPQNEEISSGKGVSGKWQTSCGSLGSSLLQATSTVYDVNISGIVFHGASGSQIFRSTVNSYACSFDNLTFYGCKHAFGAPTEKWLGTQFMFTGHWTALSYSDTPFTLGGGDAQLWVAGFLNSNSPPATVGGGRPIVDLSGMGKTNIGYMYLTAENDWVGVRVQGGLDKAVSFYGGAYEGRSQTNLATRPVIDIQGGTTYWYGPWVAQVTDASTGTVPGCIRQSAGVAYFYGGTYHKGSGVNDAFPYLYQSGTGIARFYGPPVSVTGGQIRVRWASGTTDTLAAPANGVVA